MNIVTLLNSLVTASQIAKSRRVNFKCRMTREKKDFESDHDAPWVQVSATTRPGSSVESSVPRFTSRKRIQGQLLVQRHVPAGTAVVP